MRFVLIDISTLSPNLTQRHMSIMSLFLQHSPFVCLSHTAFYINTPLSPPSPLCLLISYNVICQHPHFFPTSPRCLLILHSITCRHPYFFSNISALSPHSVSDVNASTFSPATPLCLFISHNVTCQHPHFVFKFPLLLLISHNATFQLLHFLLQHLRFVP